MHSRQQFNTIHYRGSLVEFELPADWAQDHELDGGGTFYPTDDESVTLRLSVLTLQPPPDSADSSPERVFEVGEFQGLPVEKLANGQVLCVGRVHQSEERGQLLDLHRWAVARSAPPGIVRLAVFTTTVVAGSPPHTHEIVAMLMAQVRNCRISDAPAAPPRARAWWKRLFNPRGE